MAVAQESSPEPVTGILSGLVSVTDIYASFDA
jgi:hypothetical protein